MNIRKSALSIVLAVGLVGVAGCSSSGGDSAAPEPMPETTQSTTPEATGSAAPSMDESQTAEEVVITIKDFKFQGPDSIAPGATVTVINEDAAAHTVTSEEEGLFDAVVEADSKVTFTAPDEAGDYAYVCTYHPNMTGNLVVE